MTDTPTHAHLDARSRADASRTRRTRFGAGVTRSRLLAILRESPQPLSAYELAAAAELHPNTVREQLDALVEGGTVERTARAPRGRGRPAFRYRALGTLNETAPYRELARVLVEELARDPDGSTRAIAAGERWGHEAMRAGEHATGSEQPARAARLERSHLGDEVIGRLHDLLEQSGFRPDPLTAGESGGEELTIRLRRCPFVPLASERPSIVCGVHLGLIRGALAELGAPLDRVRLEPFVEPALCLAYLGRVDGGPA